MLKKGHSTNGISFLSLKCHKTPSLSQSLVNIVACSYSQKDKTDFFFFSFTGQIKYLIQNNLDPEQLAFFPPKTMYLFQCMLKCVLISQPR